MSEFRQHFLSKSLDSLSKLREKLFVVETDVWSRDAFRVVHTIKGGAQTFGLESVARLSGEIENLLDKCKDPLILTTELDLLASQLSGKSRDENSATFTADSRKFEANVIITSLPRKHFDMLASSEKDVLTRAVRSGKAIWLIDVTVKAAELSAFFRALDLQCEVVASIAGKSPVGSSSMSFSIVAVADRYPDFPDYELSVREIGVDSHDSSVLTQMFCRLAAHVEEISTESGKNIAVTVFANPLTAGAAPDKLFPIFLHLVRNAADHGIDERGSIEINCFEDETDWFLSVSDDGRGIDIAAVHSRAIALGLFTETDPIDDETILQQVFNHGFSTSRRVTEISGRGVGLDVVKTSVDALNGKIYVRNRKNKGTIFTVVLPKENL